jgi:hypothetical protein
MTRIQTEEIARQDFISGQLDAINSLPPQSQNYYYRLGWEDATYEMSLGRINWHLNQDTGAPEPLEI